MVCFFVHSSQQNVSVGHLNKTKSRKIKDYKTDLEENSV